MKDGLHAVETPGEIEILGKYISGAQDHIPSPLAPIVTGSKTLRDPKSTRLGMLST